MHTSLCERLGIEFPIFAFTHCRDVVAAVSRAGGFGVLGAVGFSAEQLAIELDWIDQNVGDHPYGVDIVIPGKYEGVGEMDAAKLAQSLREMVPQESHRLRQEGARRPRGSGAAGRRVRRPGSCSAGPRPPRRRRSSSPCSTPRSS